MSEAIKRMLRERKLAANWKLMSAEIARIGEVRSAFCEGFDAGAINVGILDPAECWGLSRARRAVFEELPELAPPRDGALGCEGCGLPYSGDHWVAAVVSDRHWELIMPSRRGGGILCINCMARRFAAVDEREVPLRLTAGPFKLWSRRKTAAKPEEARR